MLYSRSIKVVVITHLAKLLLIPNETARHLLNLGVFATSELLSKY
jgi:hypothetical protein